MTQVRGFPDYAAASGHLNTLIVERWGADPCVIDGLNIQVLDCPHEVGGGCGKVIMAIPLGADPRRADILCTYFGDPPPRQEVAP